MTSEVIIDVQPKEISIALLEDKKLVEFQREARAEHFSVGNVYLAKVRKLMPGLNACFVNVGHERDAFLHYLDLGTRYRSFEKYLELMGDGKKTTSMNKVANLPELERKEAFKICLRVGRKYWCKLLKSLYLPKVRV